MSAIVASSIVNGALPAPAMVTATPPDDAMTPAVTAPTAQRWRNVLRTRLMLAPLFATDTVWRDAGGGQAAKFRGRFAMLGDLLVGGRDPHKRRLIKRT